MNDTAPKLAGMMVVAAMFGLLSAVSDKRMDLTCSACGHKFSYKIADLILTTSDDTESVARRAMS